MNIMLKVKTNTRLSNDENTRRPLNEITPFRNYPKKELLMRTSNPAIATRK
jgi:hypothetical protein